MKKFFLAISLVSFAFLFFAGAGKVSASVRERVLAEATPPAQLNFPPLSSGPGFILPDSPLYFLDNFFQSLRLSLAIDPENRSRVRAQIAGERLAELRVMLARNNPPGIEIALSQLTKEVGFSVKDLADAQAKGKNVSALARELNQIFKNQKNILKAVEDQTSGDLKIRLKAARLTLIDNKIEVQDRLPQDEADNEIKDDLREQLEDETQNIVESAQKAERLLERLNQESSQSAQKALERRTEAVKKAVEEKNELLKKNQEQLKKAEEKKQEELKKVQEEASEAIRKASKEVQASAEKAAEKLKKIEEKIVELQQKSTQEAD